VSPSFQLDAGWQSDLQVLWEDGDRVFRRGWRLGDNGKRSAVLVVAPAAEHPSPSILDRLAHEYGLKEVLDGAWAVRPLELVRDGGRTMLVLEDASGEPLDRLLGAPMEVGRFLRVAIGIAKALGKLHQRGLVHKDIKPANILVNGATGEVQLTGFGIASRLPRERQAAEPPEALNGTLAYMAPEQTGRMNRSIDSRSDLYALGVTFYQMLTGALPFAAADPMEWVHCHLARRPAPPADLQKDDPSAVSAIIMKLLAKTAEDRYQIAGGLESDLLSCLTEWEAQRRIDDFPLGEHDTPDRLLIPEKLYGRRREVETLLASFDRIVNGGAPELVLVSGYSGIGKSSVVSELHKALVPRRGLFASGKFDRYKRDIPYSTLAQAFQSLIRDLLAKSEADLADWRDALDEALGANGRLMIDLVPELKLIIGEQPPVAELALQDAQRRFQFVFRRFIGVFARSEHPLVLFLDDLQWLDSATLDLIEDILTQSDMRHLMLIGAYRDNEVSSSHPLMRKLDAIRLAGAPVQEIVLAPLTHDDLAGLVTDSLHCEPERATALAELIHEKTAGNPFFAIQFISVLVEEGLLTFDYGEGRWSWDLNSIRAKGCTDNIVELMVGKMNRLPVETQQALELLACMGSSVEFHLLEMVSQQSNEEMHGQLWIATRAGLIFRTEQSYRFLHDRIQEAAYSLIPPEQRALAHLRIGRLLSRGLPRAELEKHIFEIANQMNHASALITSPDERRGVAELNLLAGKRAKTSNAYAAALKYLTAGRALLTDDCWESNPDLTFEVELYRAECEFLTGDLVAADETLTILSERAANAIDRATVAWLRITLYTTLDRSDRAVEVCLAYLATIGIHWSAHPTDEQVKEEYDRLWLLLGNRSIEELVDLPLMTDLEWRATLNLLTSVQGPAMFTDQNLLGLIAGRMANLSLEHGNCEGSCFAFVWLGFVLGSRFGDYTRGLRFGRVGLDLVDHRGLTRFKPRTYLAFGTLINPWMRDLRTSRDLLKAAFDAAHEVGDLTYAAYSFTNLITNLLASGDSLGEVEHEAETGLEFSRKAKFGLVVAFITAQLQFVRALRGLTPDLASFNGPNFDERRFERELEADARLAIARCWYWIRKLQSQFYAGDYIRAIESGDKAKQLLWSTPSQFEVAEYHFYDALARAARYASATSSEQSEHAATITAHHEQLRIWAQSCPENFENRAAMVSAELARIEGRESDATRLYEQAIRSARANGFVHNEALAYELAARFYAARGFEEIAHLYLGNARQGYLRWGADGKVWQLEQLHPRLRQDERTPSPTGTIETRVERLDLLTVIKVSQAVSGEIVLEKLLETLMRAAIEHAGAERGLLIAPRGDELQIEAEATTSGEDVTVHLPDGAYPATALPESLVRYVVRTEESVFLDDARSQNPFSSDPYIVQRRARSILCLPLLSQAKLVGILYLENNLTRSVFTPDRVTVLKVLASQAAISLENSRLYRDLEDREGKIRRLVDSNIIGVFFGDFDGRIHEANDAFLRIVGYDREDLEEGRINWKDLTPRDWRERDAQWIEEHIRTGVRLPIEKEYLRKDGSRVAILLGSATFEEGGDQSVTFVLDLTERKRAEQALRELESDLARLSIVGELTASLAHEITQPIGSARNNARAALNFLDEQRPDLGEVREALGSVVGDADRAGNIIDRIRDHIKKAPPRKHRFDLNEAINEVIALAQSAIAKNGVSVQTHLTEGLAPVEGDRVQLQQVIRNLILNAVEAMSAADEGARELLVSTEQSRTNGVVVAVRDSGPGIDPKHIERVFEAFYTTKSSGVGMGLSICRSIIAAHGGRLWADANEPRGATFQFMLPAGTAASKPQENQTLRRPRR